MIQYDSSTIPSPCYLIDEEAVIKNMQLIKRVSQEAGVEIIMAFKAFALWELFPITRQYVPVSTASSLNEARLAAERLGSKAHTYAPVYSESEFAAIAQSSSHITFNSLSQFNKYYSQAKRYGVSCGLRINPEFSPVATEIYNPCAAGSRLGITRDALPEALPEGVEGLHCHALCESTAEQSAALFARVEERFGKWLESIKWINFGGGHLLTRQGYDINRLITALVEFRSRHPHLHVILEPGSAHMWRTGVLVSTIEDIVENQGVHTAILNVSFACHMPDCLEMPYQPEILGATVEPDAEHSYAYRMGGNSCLSGDFVGDWYFNEPLQVGQRIVFMDMNHYTNVKTTMFNGISMPSIALWRADNSIKMLRTYDFNNFLTR